jgi:Fic family protein
MKKEIKEMLRQSNLIEGVDSKEADEDAYDAWSFAMKKKVMKPDNILYIHKILMRRLNPRIAGKIRDCDVLIGGKRKVFYTKQLITAELMMRVCFEMLAKGVADKEDKARKVHIAFENIHPFEDGNGRVGRILFNWHRLKLGLLPYIIHVGEEQKEYYKWFK